MKTRRKKKESMSGKVLGRFDIPEDIVLDIPRIMTLGNTEVRIENYKTVLEYDDTKIQLACKKSFITISGCGLTITMIADDEVSIRGEILTIQFS